MSPTTPSAAQLLAVLDRMPEARVLLVADLVLDRFIIGRPARVSREAPVLILQQEEVMHTAGGGANAAVGVASLGAGATLVGTVGDDDEGRLLLEILEDRGVDTGGVAPVSGYATPTKTRVVGRGHHTVPQQIVRFDREARLGDDFRPSIPKANAEVVLVSDYGYGAATPQVVTALRDRWPADTRVLVDSRYRLADFEGSANGFMGATPNQEEAERILGTSIEGQPLEAAQELRRRLGCEFLLLTRGSEGMVLAVADGSARIPAHGSGEVADVTGAGDTVIATVAAALAAGSSPLEAALLANYAGGVVVTRAGTASVDRPDLANAIDTDSSPRDALEWVSA